MPIWRSVTIHNIALTTLIFYPFLRYMLFNGFKSETWPVQNENTSTYLVSSTIFKYWSIRQGLSVSVFSISILAGKKQRKTSKPSRFEKKSSQVTQWKMDGNKRNLNWSYSIFPKKHNSHGHFKYIKNIKSYLGIVVLVLSLCVQPKKFIYFYDFELKLPLHCGKLGFALSMQWRQKLLHPSRKNAKKWHLSYVMNDK